MYFPGNSGRGGLERTLIKDVTENLEGRAWRKVQDLELRMAVTVGRALQAAVWTERGLRGPWARRGRSGTGCRRKERSTECRSQGLG